MRRSIYVLVLVLGITAMVLPRFTLAAQSSDTAFATQIALNWLRDQQQEDGSFPGFGPGENVDAVFALVAGGIDPNGIITNGSSPISYLGNQASGYALKSTGAGAKLTMAVVAAGKDPRAFGGLDLTELIGRAYNPQNGQYGEDIFAHSLTLLAIRSLGITPHKNAVARLIELQLNDGGWSFDGSTLTGSDTNTTALVIQALAAETKAKAAIVHALEYLKTQQNTDGGFPYSQTSAFGNNTNANSTAYVLQALAATGQDPQHQSWTKPEGNPLSALRALQNPNGAFRFQAATPEDNPLATYQAILGLLSKPLPLVTITVPGVHERAIMATLPARLPATGALPTSESLLALIAMLLLLAGLALRSAAH